MTTPPKIERRINHRAGREGLSPAQMEETRQRVIESERLRIAQDIHDGVASQLVSLIATLDPQDPQQHRIIAALELSLLELKFVIDSLGNNFCSVIDALANLRYRIQPALDRKGIKMQWAMQDAPQLELLAPDRSIHVLRIAQEALNNVLQHSGAGEVQVTCSYDDNSRGLELIVRDNGHGFCGNKIPGKNCGNGLGNMKNRAQVLGGRLEINDDHAGTEIRLNVPVRSQESRGNSDQRTAPTPDS